MPYNNKHFFIMLHVQVFLDPIFLLQCLSQAADSNKGVLFIESTSSLATFCLLAYGRQQFSQLFHHCIKEVTVFTSPGVVPHHPPCGFKVSISYFRVWRYSLSRVSFLIIQLRLMTPKSQGLTTKSTQSLLTLHGHQGSAPALCHLVFVWGQRSSPALGQ